ncbi:MAG: glycoside hydrolase family 113 [Elusimicrobiota bacterium]
MRGRNPANRGFGGVRWIRRFLFAFLILLPAGASARPAFYGFTLPSWWKDSYESAGARKSLSNLAATGANSVALIPTWYMKTGESSTFATTDQSASDESLRLTIRNARSLGLRVVLKPHVNCQDGRATALIRPKDESLWFKNYGDFIQHYARLAQEEKVDLFVVGTELFSMAASDHRREWENIIRGVRGVYAGRITYAANWYDFMLVTFWGSLDYIGIDGYFPLAGGHSPRLLALSWQVYLPVIESVASSYGKPVLFTEVGLSSQKGANRKPWEYRDFGPVDAEVQKDYFEAFLNVFGEKPYFAGFLQWCWDLNPDAGGPADKSMTVQGKPALIVLENYFRRVEAPSPAAGLVEAARAAARARAVFDAGVPAGFRAIR